MKKTNDIVYLDSNTPSLKYLCKQDKRSAEVIFMVAPINGCIKHLKVVKPLSNKSVNNGKHILQ